jgi:nucleotide-binding universal stress UspA family protein
MKSVEKILIAIDFSKNLEPVLDYALFFAEKFQAKLYLIHVVHDLRSYTGFYDTKIPLTQLQKELQEEGKSRMDVLCKEKLKNSSNYEALVITGNPSTEILRTAQEKKIDLIILGSHREEKPQHRLLGSTAEKVSRQALCPVLVV